MGKTYNRITDSLLKFVEQQKMFFVATAPLAGDGLVNLSPKGYDTFRVLDETTVAYLDLSGSGIETVAHLKENGRLVIMFCAFEGKPNIVRFHGKGTAIERGEPGWDDLFPLFPDLPGARAIIKLKADRISDSCGFAVPNYAYTEDRDTLIRYREKQTHDQFRDSQLKGNMRSLDGLPGLSKPTVDS